MAEWKVSKEEITLFVHPNADALEIARVGTYALVVQKGLYQDGDVIVMAPKGALLPPEIAEPFQDYLSGGSRVKEVRLRGELSQGIVLPLDVVRKYVPDIDTLPFGEDVSEKLGIREYIPPVPSELQGRVERLQVELGIDATIIKFDVDNYRINTQEFQEGEEVLITEKVHGSQLNAISFNGKIVVSSKGILKQGLVLHESEGNAYWKALRNSGMYDFLLARENQEEVVQVVGELIPCQGGYDYGQTESTMRVFEYSVNGVPQVYDTLPQFVKDLWVPILYRGAFSEDVAVSHSKGMETVSGKQRHIREGCVVTPIVPRHKRRGGWLRLKLINPKYKMTGEEFN